MSNFTRLFCLRWNLKSKIEICYLAVKYCKNFFISKRNQETFRDLNGSFSDDRTNWMIPHYYLSGIIPCILGGFRIEVKSVYNHFCKMSFYKFLNQILQQFRWQSFPYSVQKVYWGNKAALHPTLREYWEIRKFFLMPLACKRQ